MPDDLSKKPAGDAIGWAAFGVAVVALGVFGGVVAYMYTLLKADEQVWMRASYLFGSIEAVAFGAAGCVFGIKIQRERVEKAEQREREISDKAVKGVTLAKAVKSAGALSANTAGAPDPLQQLKAQAQILFPEA